MNIFEKASKKGLRFSLTDGNYSVGTVNTEDLWGLSLQTLDGMYAVYKTDLDNISENTLFKTKAKNDEVLQLRCDICKSIFLSKLEDAEKAENAVAEKEKNQLIMQIILEKENDELRNDSIENLRKMISK